MDEELGGEYNKVEAEGMIKIGLLCTNGSPSLRPTMSEVVSMLEGRSGIPEMAPDPGSYNQDLRFKAIRDHHKSMNNNNSKRSSSSTSGNEIEESYLRFKAIESQTSMSAPSWTASSTVSV